MKIAVVLPKQGAGLTLIRQPNRITSAEAKWKPLQVQTTSNLKCKQPAMMNVRVLRSFGARKVSCSITRRCFSSECKKNQAVPSSRGTPPAAPPPKKFKKPRHESIGMKGTSMPQPPAQAPSKVHWALSDVYDVGGVIPRSTGPDDRTSDRGLPLWGEWGVPLEIRTVEPSTYSM